MTRRISPVRIFFSCFLLMAAAVDTFSASWIITQESDSTFLSLKQELELTKKKDQPKLLVRKHFKLGNYYLESGILSEAMDQYQQASKYIQKSSQDTLQILLNINMGKIHLERNDYDLALKFFRDALNQSDELNFLNGKATAQGLLGACFEKTGEYLEALNYEKESLKYFESIKDSAGISVVNENIGSIYEDLSQFELAFNYFNIALEHLGPQNSPAKISILNNLGDVFRKQNNYPEAIQMTQKALKLAEETQDFHQLESANKDLSKTYSLMGDYQKAFEYMLEVERYKELGLEAQNTNQINKLQAIYDSNKKESQIQLLQEKDRANAANQRLLILSFTALAIILALTFFFLQRRRKGQLKVKEYEQRTLQAELEKKAIEEKNMQHEIQLKSASLSKYSLHISQMNKILLDLSNSLKNIANRKNLNHPAKIKDLSKEIDYYLQQENEWDEFIRFFEDIHPDFVK
ncbi:MAG: tetratricopeptide repeat protein, partial [Bacteroidota bacterium]